MKCSKASVMRCFLWQKNGGNMIFGNKIELLRLRLMNTMYQYWKNCIRKVLLPIFQVWCQAIAYLDLWGAYPLPFEQKIYVLSDPTSTSTSCDSQIRRYTNNSWLVAHLDRSEINILSVLNTLKNGQEQEAQLTVTLSIIRLGTHVVSAILNVGQKVDRDWPLHIQDNQGNNHRVYQTFNYE